MQGEIVEVDARGLSCPLPLLKAKKALNALACGELLRVLSTDTGSVRDFRVFCEQSGHELLESGEQNGVYVHVLRKSLRVADSK
jgi:tRNA 2-thiouridine synthesizing protein A